MNALTADQITAELSDLPGWEFDGEAITKTYALPTFREAIEFVNDLADLAEEENHHPDIEIYFDEVVVSFRTHSEEAVTDRDVEMAREVESLVTEIEDFDEDDEDDEDEDEFDDEYDDLEDADD